MIEYSERYNFDTEQWIRAKDPVAGTPKWVVYDESEQEKQRFIVSLC